MILNFSNHFLFKLLASDTILTDWVWNKADSFLADFSLDKKYMILFTVWNGDSLFRIISFLGWFNSEFDLIQNLILAVFIP